jgi:hypothetical protein
MKLTPPKAITWWIALVLAVLGIVAKFVSMGPVTTYNFWFVVASAVLLLIATLLKGL